MIDMRNQRFGRLFVIERSSQRKAGAQIHWICRCDCGNYTIVRGQDLRLGKTKSCGCYALECRTKHGGFGSKLYNIWRQMRYRCNTESCDAYKWYGSRGISVCQEWNDDFKAFHDWAIANGYKEGLSIERIDVNKGYEPSNCTWIPQSKQLRNTRRNLKITINGETKPLVEWAEMCGIKYSTIRGRYNRGDTGERLIRPLEK